MQTLSDLLTEETILLQASARDWREAIRLGGELLVHSGAVTPDYLDAMIRFTEELGPYIVIAPGLAIPHARPEEGVLKLGFSLVTLKTPVEFGIEYNDPVDVLFCMAAPDNEAHIEALRQVATLCCNEGHFCRIREATRPEEVLEVVAECENPKTCASTE
jgi:mannitol/fructose-specific phosphotransferase system IIA component (Ntr-type)